MPLPPATLKKALKHKTFIVLSIGIFTFAAAVWALYTFGSDRGRFLRQLNGVRTHPEKWIGKETTVATTFSEGVSSRFIAATVERAYIDLSQAFAPQPKTYVSEYIDMPTQETVWQFPSYFVRLSTVSALECDNASIGVFSGTYEDYRKQFFAPDAKTWMRFTLIEYKSPRRFLYPDR